MQKYWAEKVGKTKLDLHAEIAAATKANPINLLDATLYVVRINKQAELRCSYPCKICYPFLQHVGIRRIVCVGADRQPVAIEL